jgi:hypothetical protein
MGIAEIEAELKSVHPSATASMIGHHRIYWFSDETPMHKFDSVLVATAREKLIELTARDSYDECVARSMLDCVDGRELPSLGSDQIEVIPAQFPAPVEFDVILIVPPRIARRFEHQSDVLQAVTYWVLPAFSGEFVDGASGKEFWHQLYRKDGWKIPVIQWDRSRKTERKFE